MGHAKKKFALSSAKSLLRKDHKGEIFLSTADQELHTLQELLDFLNEKKIDPSRVELYRFATWVKA